MVKNPDNTLAIIAVITTGITGLGAALIAAVFARSRQQDELDASRLRLQAQLDHQRGLSDIAELRTLLDQVINDMNSALGMLIEASVAATSPMDSEKILKLTADAHEPISGLYASVRHLMFRLGRGHACPMQLNEVAFTLSGWSKRLGETTVNATPLGDEEVERLHHDSAKKTAEFVDLIVPLVGSRM